MYNLKIIVALLLVSIGFYLNKLAWSGELRPTATVGSIGLVFGVGLMIFGAFLLVKTIIQNK